VKTGFGNILAENAAQNFFILSSLLILIAPDAPDVLAMFFFFFCIVLNFKNFFLIVFISFLKR